MNLRDARVGFVLAAASLTLPALSSAQNIVAPDFYVENVAPGASFVQPTVLEFTSDGRILVAEKSGVVYVVQNGVKLQQPFVNLSADVLNHHDRGLLGMALDPDFDNNGYVYFLYTFDWNGAGDNQRKDVVGRLVRYTVDTLNPNTIDASTRLILIGPNFTEGIPACYFSHAPGDIHFGSDGSLLVAAGDGASYSEMDPGGLYPECFGPGKLDSGQDIGAFRSQWIGTMAGKILRVNPANGEGYPSNPFYTGDPTDIESKVWAYGLRNPYRFGIRPGGSADPADGNPGTVYAGDVGWNTWEEINVAETGGENFGWPCYEGPNPQGSYQSGNPAHHDCSTIGTPDNPSLPIPGVTYWKHGNGAESFPAGISGSSAIGGDFYQGNKYPAQYQGRFFYGDYSGGWMKMLEVDANNNFVGVEDFGDNMGGLVELRYDRFSQYMYYVEINSGTVYRIRNTQGDTNGAPIIVADLTPNYGYTPLVVQASASQSYDPDGDNITFEWDFGDGGSAVSPDTQYTYLSDGDYTVTLTVRDEFDTFAVEQFTVSAGNTPPSVEILLPENGDFVSVGDQVILLGQASDAEDAEETLSYSWEVTQGHNDHTHPNFYTATTKAAQFDVVEHGLPNEVNFLTARLTVTDPRGLSGVQTHYLVLNRANEIDVTSDGTATALVMSPTGTGNPDIAVIHDGVFPVEGSNDPLQQYDTYDGGGPRALDWIGYTFPTTRYFSRLVWQEGVQYGDNGGWFDSLWVEVRVDGIWEPVDYRHELPPYAGNDSINYTIHAITFEAHAGDAIRLIGTPGGASSFTSTGELRVWEIPRAEFSADARVGSSPLTVTFTDESIVTNPTTWLWTFGDGNTSNLPSPMHTYALPGPHSVSLTVTGDEGTFFEKKDNYIFVGSPGLLGDYYDDPDFAGAVVSRIDSVVDFNWGTGAPDGSMGADDFSVRWSGWIRPRYSELLTIHTTTNDGVRLWINNNLLIDEWVDQSATEHTGSIALVADELYELRMEYYEATGDAEARLEWSSPSQAREVIPESRLFARECASGIGDVNGDGTLTPGDALCALQTFLNGQIPTSACNITGFDCEVTAADTDCSGMITPSDALAIYNRYLSGLPLEVCFAQGMPSPAAPRYATTVSQRTVLGTEGLDDIIEVTLAIEDPRSLDAFGLTALFPPQNVRFLRVERTPYTEDWLELAAVQTEAGSVRIGGFNPEGITRAGSTPLLRVVFSAPDVTDASPVELVGFVDDLANARVVDTGGGGDTPVPGAFQLHQNYPNPFNPETSIRFDVPAGTGATRTRLAIYSVGGELVRVLVDETRSAGFYEVRWDGTNQFGAPVPSGVYFYSLEAGGFKTSRRMVLLK